MSTSNIALSLFTVLNAVRLVGYIPQISKIVRDTHGAEAISITTWSLFTLSNASTVIYAALYIGDLQMSVVFAANAVCCLVITVLAAWKRSVLRRS